eukprot:1972148-Alexandrium_andersonii.AAC.1
MKAAAIARGHPEKGPPSWAVRLKVALLAPHQPRNQRPGGTGAAEEGLAVVAAARLHRASGGTWRQ